MGITDNVKEGAKAVWDGFTSAPATARDFVAESSSKLTDTVKKSFTAMYTPSNIVKPAKGILNGSSAFARSRVGMVVLGSAAAIAGVVGIGSGLHKKEQASKDFITAQAVEASALQENIVQNQAKIAQMSAELGQANGQGNFREAVRGTGAGVTQTNLS